MGEDLRRTETVWCVRVGMGTGLVYAAARPMSKRTPQVSATEVFPPAFRPQPGYYAIILPHSSPTRRAAYEPPILPRRPRQPGRPRRSGFVLATRRRPSDPAAAQA